MNNQTIDGVPRRICHACVTYPRDAYCPVCDPAAQPHGDPVAYRCRHSATEPWFFSDKPGYWEWQALYASPPAPVAPTPINYGALDPVERLAVCRGEVAL